MNLKHQNAFPEKRDGVFGKTTMFNLLIGLFIIAVLVATTLKSYLLYHTLAEFFSIAVAWGLFIVVWNTKDFIEDQALVFIGTAYLFVGAFDMVHTVSYKGMGIPGPDAGANPATQLWIAARFIESFSLLVFPFLLHRPVKAYRVFAVYLVLSCLIMLTIFHWEVFPACYVEGEGPTLFKKLSEYVICTILALAALFLHKKRKAAGETIYIFMTISIALTILAETAFLFHVDGYGLSNMVGRLFKVGSFYCVYLAFIKSGLRDPYAVLFRKLRENKSFQDNFLDLVEVIPTPVFYKDRQGRYTGFNRSFERFFGEKREEIIGKTVFDIHPPELAETYKARDDELFEKGGTQSYEFQMKNGSGSYRDVIFNKAVLTGTEGKVEGIIGGFVDISDRKEFEEQLKQANTRLQEETRRANEMALAAEKANNAKSEFLSNMSHEIRTPLNAVIGFSQMLDSKDFGRLNSRQTQYVNHILEGGNRLLELINDILDLSRVESGKTRSNPAPFHLEYFMERIESTLSVSAEANGLTLKVDIASGLPEYLTGDEKLIGQVLRNLISNAVKFTEQGEIHVSVENRAGDLRQFKVSDTGAGIPEDKQHRLFDKFYQADSSYTKNYEGTGLGLAISKNLVELMGGEIGFESEQGKGSTFHFTLELPSGGTEPANSVPESFSPETEPELRPGLKILLAEDDPLNRKAMTHFLEKAGHTVQGAENGNEVVSALEQDRFDIILMDVQMPEMDGVEATKTIRNCTSGLWNPDIPILALTAYAMSGDRKGFMDAGMTDYISKPVNFAELNQKINRMSKDGAREDESSKKDPPQPSEENHDSVDREEDLADVRAFLDSNAEDPEFAGQILKSFPGHVSERMARIKAALENRDAKEAAEAAHKFIALFSAVHIHSACETSRELQTAAGKGDLESCQRLFRDLESRMNKIVPYMESISEKRG